MTILLLHSNTRTALTFDTSHIENQHSEPHLMNRMFLLAIIKTDAFTKQFLVSNILFESQESTKLKLMMLLSREWGQCSMPLCLFQTFETSVVVLIEHNGILSVYYITIL